MADKRYDNPESRLRESYGDPLTDKIIGILIGFKDKLEEREMWLDIITTRQAEREIRQLLKDQKDGKFK
ncbi:MAG: hypothetical protein GY797_36280 [Deltaproteobacteria bacterium]|nr:hypothetical protein [Deltaproteobacteria bacterium]